MELPEPIQELVARLGEALVQALAQDPQSREIARQIQEAGFDTAVMVEATIALHQREAEAGEGARPRPEPSPEPERPTAWSEEDRAFLKTFKISLD